MDLEEKIKNSGDSGFLDKLWKRKWLRRSILPLAAATSIFFSYPRLSEAITSKQQTTLTHDPVLLIHGLKIGQDSLEEYCDFNANKIVDFDDFFMFSERFGAKEGDKKYDRGFDLNRDGDIGLEDFFLFSINFNRTVEPLEVTWDALSISLHRDLKWTNGGTIGKWMPNRDLQSADFYTIRLSSGNKLNFREQGEEVKLAVDKISEATKKKVILAGFSMGGLSARAYLQNNPNPKASALVTICTPHSGSYLAYLPERSEISRWAASIPKVGWVAQAADFFLFYLSLGKPAINYLEPCSPELELLNSEIYKMPADITYVDVISQLPDQDLLKKIVNDGIDLINKYKQGYQKCRQVASEDLLVKGDGVVPTVSQLLRYAILNTNTKNVEWYEKAKKNITENAEMEVFHTGGNKQTAVIKKVLEDIIKLSKEGRGNSPPNTPILSLPPLGTSDAPISLNPNSRRHLSFSWKHSEDPDKDDVLYDLYVSDTSPPNVLVASDLNYNYISIDKTSVKGLKENGTYYWKVVAKDKHGAFSSSDIWNFKTINNEKIDFLGKIFFVTWFDTNNIYYMDGSNDKVNGVIGYESFIPSIDVTRTGDKVAFSLVQSDARYDDAIYTVGLDGNNIKRIVNGTTFAWSPSGNRIVYESAYSLGILDQDGKIENLNLLGEEPSWSPDERKILYSYPQIDENYRSTMQIHLLSLDKKDKEGKYETRKLTTQGNNISARFSPDGNSIVFLSNKYLYGAGYQIGGYCYELYTMNPDGTNQKRLSYFLMPMIDEIKDLIEKKSWDDLSNYSTYYPYWSPDGKKIVFSSSIALGKDINYDGLIGRDNYTDQDIYIMDSNGKNVKKLTPFSYQDDRYPVWSK